MPNFGKGLKKFFSQNLKQGFSNQNNQHPQQASPQQDFPQPGFQQPGFQQHGFPQPDFPQQGFLNFDLPQNGLSNQSNPQSKLPPQPFHQLHYSQQPVNDFKGHVNKKNNASNGDIYFQNGEKAYDRFTNDAFYDNRNRAFIGLIGDVYYRNGNAAYFPLVNNIYTENGSSLDTKVANYSGERVSMSFKENEADIDIRLGDDFRLLISINKSSGTKSVRLLDGLQCVLTKTLK